MHEHKNRFQRHKKEREIKYVPPVIFKTLDLSLEWSGFLKACVKNEATCYIYFDLSTKEFKEFLCQYASYGVETLISRSNAHSFKQGARKKTPPP